jgi:hypothetical protein
MVFVGDNYIYSFHGFITDSKLRGGTTLYVTVVGSIDPSVKSSPLLKIGLEICTVEITTYEQWMKLDLGIPRILITLW